MRTIAILMVVLTHIPQTWPENLSRFSQALIYFFYSSGKIGVSILFLMTGLLMARLHPRPDIIGFWARRLARVLPPFLVMVASLTLIRASGNTLPVLIQLGLVLGFATIARICARPIGRKFTLAWIGFMIAAAAGYVFWLEKIPPAVFYQLWPAGWRWLVNGVMNAAMALPFGRYVAQLDGVYWAIIIEVWFYLLYPVLFVPFLTLRRRPALFFASLFFGFGLSLLAKRIPGLDMVNPEFIIYFIAGVGLGSNLTWWQQRIKQAPTILLLMLIAAGQYWLTAWLPEFYYPWVRLILVFPVALLVLNTTIGKSFWRPLTVLGKYSYSIFLTHSLVIEWLTRIINPTGLLTNFILVLISLGGSLGLAAILYFLAEKPYLAGQKLANRQLPPGPAKPLLGLIAASLILLDLAFRPPLAFFTSITRHGASGKIMVLGSEPRRFEFLATENNLGMITAHLKSAAANTSRLLIRLYDERGELINATDYKAADLYENSYHPFGFPVQPDSRGKSYTLELELTQPDPARPVKLIADEQQFISVYFNPQNRRRWLVNKLTAPYTNPLYWFTLANLTPLLALLIYKYRRG